MSNNITFMPQRYKRQFDWVFSAYENAGVTLPEGFQKDAIQNAVGARRHDRWDNWNCDIYVVSNEKGTFLVVEDSGTVGLTGENMSMEKIRGYGDRDEDLDPEERLARFSSMNNSGGNKMGGGLYGVGKTVYSVSSKKYCYYFDSLREDGKYVANFNDAGRIHERAYEGEEAKKFIFETTGLEEKKSQGTRVIIADPKQEIVDSISSGEMLAYIQESWWLIIKRLGNNSNIKINHEPVVIPNGITETRRNYNLPSPTVYKTGYRVKNLGIYLFEDGNNRWQGISYYRKGMKIGEIELDDIPEKVRNKFWGYVEVDEQWEDELATIEDSIHFGVSKTKKRSNTYQYLKLFCAERFKALLIEWGYIKDHENENKRLQEELDKIAEELQDIFDEMGFEDLGKGAKKPDFDVRWNNIKYPSENSESVTTDEIIAFSVRINSAYLTDKKFEYSLIVIDPSTQTIISRIDDGTVKINAGKTHEIPYEFIVNRDTALRYAENRIVLKVKVNGGTKEKIKELPFFFDIEKPKNVQTRILLTLHTCDFPNEESRRVNFGEKLQNVSYRIDNHQNSTLHYLLKVRVHNAEDTTCPKIAEIASLKGEISAYEEDVVSIPDILFDEEIYAQYLEEGRLQLRAELSAAEDSGAFEKGEKITRFFYDIYLNMDEKNGKRNSFEKRCLDKPENHKRAWYDIVGTRTIFINIGHRAYTRLADHPEMQHHYMFEQMLRQYVLIYLAEGQFSMFQSGDEEFLNMDPVAASQKVMDQVEEIYYTSLNR